MGHIVDCLRANERLETTLQASDTCLEDFGGMFIHVYTFLPLLLLQESCLVHAICNDRHCTTDHRNPAVHDQSQNPACSMPKAPRSVVPPLS